jgi:hypothetical protein
MAAIKGKPFGTELIRVEPSSIEILMRIPFIGGPYQATST